MPFKRYANLALLLLAAVTIFRLWYCSRLELVADEAYYYLWSQHLDIGYYDKGPIIAWIIALGTTLAGPTEVGVRWLGVMISSGIAWLLFLLARRLCRDDRVAFASLILSCVMPLYAVGSIIMTIDTPLVFFWVLAAWLFWQAVESGRKRDWFLTGLAVGLGFLSKFNSAVELVSFFLFLIVVKRQRRYVLSSRSLLMVFAFALCLVPMVYWNSTHGWINIYRIESRGGLDHSFHFSLTELWKFLLEQALVMSPLVFIGLLIAVYGTLRKGFKDEADVYLLSLFLPLFLLFCFFSLNEAGKGNWTAAALVGGVIVAARFWIGMVRRYPVWKWAAVVALALALTETTLLHNTRFLHLKKDPMDRARGWRDLASRVDVLQQQFQPDFLVCNDYQTASLLTFYLNNHVSTFTPDTGRIENQLSFWGSYLFQGGDRILLIVDKKAEVPDAISRQFAKVILVSDFTTQEEGRSLQKFFVYLCRN